MACDAWIQDPRCASNADRVKHRDWLCTELAALFATRPAAHWLQLLQQTGVPAAPINSVREELDHPLTTARSLKIEIDGVPLLGSALRLTDSPPRHERAPPALGAHNEEIATMLGFDHAPRRASGAMA
jgi:crotonobetainyl-CoA:carnitine CoA-transferase CaiB-like acyl-CoA transferase